MELQKPHEELLKIYKELKELQYKKVREEVLVQANSKKIIESSAGIKECASASSTGLNQSFG